MANDLIEPYQWREAQAALRNGTTVLVHVAGGDSSEWYRAFHLMTIKGQKKAKLLTSQEWVDVDGVQGSRG
jgi:hypothetical protein